MSDEIVIYQPKFEVSESNDNLERMQGSNTIDPGSYWIFSLVDQEAPEDQDLKALKEGDVLLLIDYAVDENNAVHNVTLLMPPEFQSRTINANTTKLLVEDLYRYFSPCSDGEARRKSQLDKRMAELSDMQKRITDINKDPRKLLTEMEQMDDANINEAKLRLQNLKTLPAPNAGTDITSSASAQSARDSLESKVEIAKATGLVLAKMNEDLSSKAMVVGSYHSEIGHLAMAKTKEARDLVKRVEGAVASLDIYLGKNVDVVAVKRGEPGDRYQPFRLYQDMLYMDEESLINSNAGGADYADVNLFLENLKTDSSLQERIFGFDRSIVIIRPRRRDKYYDGDSPFESSQKNQANKFSFLLVRDGENITAIHHPMGFLSKLFPSLSDMDNAFKRGGWADCRNVTRDDIAYTSSLDMIEQIKRNYKRIVLMLQGIIDRDDNGEVFGEFAGGKPMLLNPEDQARVFEFITLENAIIDDSRPRYDAWLSSLNRDLRVGSLVCVTGFHITSNNTPAAFSFFGGGQHAFQNYELKDEGAFFNEPQIIEKHGEHIGFKRAFSKYGDNERNMVIRILDNDIKESRVIDLESVRSCDITYYLNSRRERTHYESYIPQLLALRSLAESEEARTRLVRDKVTGILRDAGKQVDDDKVFQAVMKYRADNKGYFDPDTHNNKKAIELILNIYWQLSNGGDQLVTEIIEHFKDESVVLVTATAASKIHVYTVNEQNALAFDDTGFPWFSRYTLENPKTMRFSKAKPARASDIRGKVTFLYRSDHYDDERNRQDTFHGLSFIQHTNLIAKVAAAGIEKNPINSTLSVIDKVLAKETISEAEFEEILERYKWFYTDLKIDNPTATMISLPILSLPIGIATIAKRDNQKSDTPKVSEKAMIVRLNVRFYDLICELIHRVENLDTKGEWFKGVQYKIYRMTNEHHRDTFALDREQKVASIHYGLSKMNESISGVLSEYYGAGVRSFAILKGDRESRYDYLLGDILKAQGIKAFTNALPILSEVALSSITLANKNEGRSFNLVELREHADA